MSRSKAFLSGAVFAHLNHVLVALAALWLTPFYLRSLGAHDYGVWLVGLQVLNYLVLCDLGVLAVIPRDVAQAHGREIANPESDELQLLMGRTTKICVFQTALVAAVALVLFLTRPTAASGLRGPIALVLATFVLTYPFRLLPAFLTGLQELHFVGKIRVWTWAVSTATTVVLLLLGFRYYALAGGWCLLEVSGYLVCLWRLHRIRPELFHLSLWRKAGPFRWQWFSRGLWVSLGQFSGTLVAGSDLLIVGRFLGASSVVIYSCTGKLVQALQQQPQALAAVALPGLSNMKASESRERIRRAATALTQSMVFIGGAIFCVVLPLNQQFVKHWTGPAYFGGVRLTLLFLVNFLARLIDYTLAISLFAFGYEKLYAIRCLLDGLVSVTIATLLVRHFGQEGVITGLMCGVLLIGIPFDLYCAAREFRISLFEAARPYLPYLWRLMAVGAGAYLVFRRVEFPNLVVLAVAAIGIGLVYLLVVLPYLLKSELGGYVRNAMTWIWTALRGRYQKAAEPALTSSQSDR